MKKIAKTLLVAALGLTITACNNSSTSSTVVSNSTNTQINVDEVLNLIGSRIILGQHKTEVLNDFEVPSKVIINYDGAEITTPITWTADKENVTFVTNEGVTTAKLNKPRKGTDSVVVKLTASYEYSGKTATKNFEVTVLPESLETLVGDVPTVTWSEWIAAENGTELAVEGTVTAYTYDSSYSNGNIFLQDEDGGYYAYRLKASLSEYQKYFNVGNKVIIKGKKDLYNGFHEFASSSNYAVQLVEAGNERPEAIDITSEVKAGNIRKYQSMWTKVLGTYISDDSGKSLQVGGNTYEIYHDTKYNQETYDAVTEAFAGLESGDPVYLTGLVGCYNADQFHPYFVEKSDSPIVVTDEEKATMALNEAGKGFDELYNTKTEIELYASEDTAVTVSYALNAEADTDVFALDTEANKLTINPTDVEKEATLTITAKCGETTKTDEITLKAYAAIEITSLEEATTIGLGTESGQYTDEKYYIAGTIKALYGKEENALKYGNFTITDGITDFVVYGLYTKDGSTRYDAMETKPVVGDEVVLYGVLGNYGGTTAQMKDARLHTFMDITSLEEATTIGLEQEEKTYTTEKYYIRGTIKALYGGESNALKYGNFTITDGTNDYIVYGMYNADGTVRYDAMETKPVVGDEVVLYGVLGTYNGSEAQMNNGWLMAHYPAVSTETPDTPVENASKIDFTTATNISNGWNQYSDVKVGDYSFDITQGNQYVNSDNEIKGIGIGVNKASNLSKAAATPEAILTGLGENAATGENAQNATLIMKFDVENVSNIAIDFLKITENVSVYLLESTDEGVTYTVVSTITSANADSTFTYTPTATVSKARYAISVCGTVDGNSYARLSAMTFGHPAA